MQIIFSDRSYKSIMAETLEMIDTETGGLFLGTFVDDCCYIVENIDPGIECIFEPAFFEYDKNYTQHLINKIAKIYEYKLELVVYPLQKSFLVFLISQFPLFNIFS